MQQRIYFWLVAIRTGPVHYSYESLLRMIITGSITLGKSYLLFNSVITFQLSNNGIDAGLFSRTTSRPSFDVTGHLTCLVISRI